jgi:NAD(P)-dependent dehydrogenase (short-subunit alcohol dehydrogenase family)
MKQRFVVITGAAGGIGKASIELFSKKGWNVIGIDRAPYTGEFPGFGTFIQADVSKEKAWSDIKEIITDITNSIAAIVNNAAIQVTKPLVETTVKEWDQVLNTNLRSVFLAIKTLYPYLKEDDGGAIVNVSSVHAVATSKDIAAYAASKGGMLALTRALAIEMAPDNIRVNAVLPGAVDTDMLRAGLNRDHAGGGSAQERLDNLAKNTVSGKIGKPEEIARIIHFLADQDESSFITGQPIVIDGGATARLSTE